MILLIPTEYAVLNRNTMPRIKNEEDAKKHLRRILGSARDLNSPDIMDDDQNNVDGSVAHGDTARSSNSPSSPTDNEPMAGGSKSPQDMIEPQDEAQDEPQDEVEEIPQGELIYQDDKVLVYVKQVKHKKRSRYEIEDHLFNITVKAKKRDKKAPLLINIDEAIDQALVKILDNLKAKYPSGQNRQIYLTVIEKGILNGLCSSNWDLNTPSEKLSRHVVTLLYNYLKSNSTLRLNPSFKIMIKVISLSHETQLETRPPRRGQKTWKKHIFKKHFH